MATLAIRCMVFGGVILGLVATAGAQTDPQPAPWTRAALVRTVDCGPSQNGATESFLLSRVFAPSDPSFPCAAPWAELAISDPTLLTIPAEAGWAFGEATITKPGWYLLEGTHPTAGWHSGRQIATGPLPTPLELPEGKASFHFQVTGASALRLTWISAGISLRDEGAVLPEIALQQAGEAWAELSLVNASTEPFTRSFVRTTARGGVPALSALPSAAPGSVTAATLRIAVPSLAAPGTLPVQVEILGEGMKLRSKREVKLTIVPGGAGQRVNFVSLRTARLLSYRAYPADRGPMDEQDLGLLCILGEREAKFIASERRSRVVIEISKLPGLAALGPLELLDIAQHADDQFRTATRERWAIHGLRAPLDALRISEAFPGTFGLVRRSGLPTANSPAYSLDLPAGLWLRPGASLYSSGPGAAQSLDSEVAEYYPMRRNESIREIQFHSFDIETAAASAWIRAEAVEKAGLPFSFDCTGDFPARTVTGQTQNLRRISFDQKYFSTRDPIHVTLDGQTITLELDGDTARWHAERTSEGWRAVARSPLHHKRPERAGGFGSLFLRNLVLVPATGGDDAARKWALERAQSDAAMLQQWGASAGVVLDSELKPEEYPTHSFLLYGSPRDHKLAATLLVGDPVGFGPEAITLGTRQWGGDDLALRWVRPRPNHPSALVGCVAASGPVGRALLDLLPTFGPNLAGPDFIMFDPSFFNEPKQGVVAAGNFGIDWSFEAGEFEFR